MKSILTDFENGAETVREPFWKNKSLNNMTHEEWESICARCGKCCLYKVNDPNTQAIRYTDIACHLFDVKTCTCKSYDSRTSRIALCRPITPENVKKFSWLPKSCAYRLLSEGKDLPEWHHLVSGDPGLIHKLGRSVSSKKVTPKKNVHPLTLLDHIIKWVY